MSDKYKDTRNLLERIDNQPGLREQIEKLVTIAEAAAGTPDALDDIEELILQAGPQLQKCIFQNWLNNKQQAIQEVSNRNTDLHQHKDIYAVLTGRVKKMMWHTVLGELAIEETIYRDKRTNHEIRPFRKLIRLEHRDYSLKLQRIIVDFGVGVDESFRKAEKKLQEHYGISISHTAIREITLTHALQAKQYEESAKKPAALSKDSQILSETDGTMIPVVEHPAPVKEEQSSPIDHRKNKQCVYKEAKLSMARLVKVGDIVIEKKAAAVKFEATTGDKKDSGERIKHCLNSLGANKHTALHVVGDGALWIEEQYRQVTSGKSRYLIDFYHLMGYLKPAANGYINQKNPDTDFNQKENDKTKQTWLEMAISKIKGSRIHEVVEELKPHVEAAHYKEKPIKDFVTYVENRPQQFDYKSAIDAGLPIGSGEIESANKSLIQQRIKIPGAWWKLENADYLIALRAMIANGHWENYWQYCSVNMRLS